MGAILLDTQAYLWSITGDARLTASAREAIVTMESAYLSVASLWEIGIKVGLNKLDIEIDLGRLIGDILGEKAVKVLPVEPNHILRIARPPHYHCDPFDRMIVAQALEDNLTVVGSDRAFDAYGVRRIF